MVHIRNWKPEDSAPQYSVCCDSTGRTGRWKCENLAPGAQNRDISCECATAVGWAAVGGKWYCPPCQRDGFVPAPQEARVLQLHTS